VTASLPAGEALIRLREGNKRYASNVRSLDALLSHVRRADMVTGQRPVAIVLGCSDSRVPAEVVFDQGLGDLFVIRVAGNIVAPSQVASVEFAAERFGTRLVIVLGHTGCSAVQATIEDLDGAPISRALKPIVDRIRPAVEPLRSNELARDRVLLARAAARANVSASASHLRHGSPVLEELIAQGLLVVGAEYQMDTGEVDFFDGVP
jgi:carbonic anhydrase